MKTREACTHLKVAAMRAAFVVAAIFMWTLDDVVDLGGSALVALVELVGNALHIAFDVTVGPFLKLREAWGLRKRIGKDTTWTKQRK